MSSTHLELETEIIRFFVEKPEFSKQYILSLSEDDFSFEHMKEIFTVISENVESGRIYDRTLILQEVSGNELAVRTFDLSSSLDTDNIKLYVEKLKDQSSKRLIEEYLNESPARLKKRISARTFAGQSIDFFKEVMEGSAVGEDVALSLKEYVSKHKGLVGEVRAGKSLGLTSGFELLDDYMAGGFKKGDLILIGARPSVGKTSLALTFSYNAAKSGAKVLFISVEMKMKDVFDRLLAFESKKSLTDIIRGTVDLESSYEALSKLNFKVVEAPKCTSRDVMSIATREKYVNGLDLVVVDYLQYLSDYTKGQNESVRVGKISRNLKSLAGTLDIPIISPTQLNRKSETRVGESKGIPSLEDLRDSGNLEQDADVVMLLHRRYDNPGEATLHLAKNRKGETGGLKLKFDPKTTKFDLLYEEDVV